MVSARHIGGIGALVIAASMIITCTEKTYVVTQAPTDSVHIRGTLFAWRCQVGDTWNNPHNIWDIRFGVATGRSAALTFIRDNGFQTTVKTDSISEFELYLSAGSHKVAISTAYTYPPDTIRNLHLMPGDTTLHLDIVYRALDPDNLGIDFTYPAAIDTAGAAAEWAAILRLNDRSFVAGKYVPVLDIRPQVFPTDSRKVQPVHYTGAMRVIYTLPVTHEGESWRSSYNVIEGYNVLQGVLRDGTSGEFPASMEIIYPGGYVCVSTAQSPPTE